MTKYALTAIYLFLLATALLPVCYSRWPNVDEDYINDDFADYPDKRNQRLLQCVGTAGRCLTPGQCCNGLLCASLDADFGKRPQVAGYCVKTKELKSCVSNADCGSVKEEEGGILSPDSSSVSPSSYCVLLGLSGQRFCMPSGGAAGVGEGVAVKGRGKQFKTLSHMVMEEGGGKNHQPLNHQPTDTWKHFQRSVVTKGALGSPCMDSSDCQSTTDEMTSSGQQPIKKLCCQKVNMGRQKTRLLCDPIKPISVCIGPPVGDE